MCKHVNVLQCVKSCKIKMAEHDSMCYASSNRDVMIHSVGKR